MNPVISRKSKRVDAYIMRCIQEGKISVDCDSGQVISHRLRAPYKQMTCEAGYKYLDFKFFRSRQSVRVHRVVYLACHGNIPRGYVIDHIDRNPANNSISNLRAVTHSKNCKNRQYHNGRCKEC